MGNAVSTEQEDESSQSSVEEWPPIKHWTAERAREEGLAPSSLRNNNASLLPRDELSIRSTAPSAHKENTRPPQTGLGAIPSKNRPWICASCGLINPQSRTACIVCSHPAANDTPPNGLGDVVRPASKNRAALRAAAEPTTPTRKPKRTKKQQRGTLERAGKPNKNNRDMKTRRAKYVVPDSESDYESPNDRQFHSDPTTSSSHENDNGNFESPFQWRHNACMRCLSRMGSTRLSTPFLGCNNQPGRTATASCQSCRQASQGCYQPPAELEDVARALQVAWEDARRDLITSGRPSIPHAVQVAWEQYSRGLKEFKATQAAERAIAPPQTTGRLSMSSGPRTLIPDLFTTSSRTQGYAVEPSDTANSGEKETRSVVRGSDSDSESLDSIEKLDRAIEEAEARGEYNDSEEQTSSADSDSDSDGKSLDSLEELERIIEAEAAKEDDEEFCPDNSSDTSEGYDSDISTVGKRRRRYKSRPGSAPKRIRSRY